MGLIPRCSIARVELIETAMSDAPVRQSVTLVNRQGLHARPADMIARLASRFESRVEIVKEAQRVDAKSILNLLTLGAESGTALVIEATGNDAAEAVRALVELIESGFPEQGAAKTANG